MQEVLYHLGAAASVGATVDIVATQLLRKRDHDPNAHTVARLGLRALAIGGVGYLAIDGLLRGDTDAAVIGTSLVLSLMPGLLTELVQVPPQPQKIETWDDLKADYRRTLYDSPHHVARWKRELLTETDPNKRVQLEENIQFEPAHRESNLRTLLLLSSPFLAHKKEVYRQLVGQRNLALNRAEIVEKHPRRHYIPEQLVGISSKDDSVKHQTTMRAGKPENYRINGLWYDNAAKIVAKHLGMAHEEWSSALDPLIANGDGSFNGVEPFFPPREVK